MLAPLCHTHKQFQMFSLFPPLFVHIGQSCLATSFSCLPGDVGNSHVTCSAPRVAVKWAHNVDQKKGAIEKLT